MIRSAELIPQQVASAQRSACPQGLLKPGISGFEGVAW
jgi:hypothetical protein